MDEILAVKSHGILTVKWGVMQKEDAKDLREGLRGTSRAFPKAYVKKYHPHLLKRSTKSVSLMKVRLLKATTGSGYANVVKFTMAFLRPIFSRAQQRQLLKMKRPAEKRRPVREAAKLTKKKIKKAVAVELQPSDADDADNDEAQAAASREKKTGKCPSCNKRLPSKIVAVPPSLRPVFDSDCNICYKPNITEVADTKCRCISRPCVECAKKVQALAREQ